MDQSHPSQPQQPYGSAQPQPYGQQPYAQPQQQYGQYPYAQPQQPDAQYDQPNLQGWRPQASYGAAPVSELERPQTLNYAVYLMFAGAGLAIVEGVARWLTIDQITTVTTKGNPPPEVVNFLTGLVQALGVFAIGMTTLIVMGLWLWMAFANRGGRAWARIVATVFAALAVGSAISQSSIKMPTVVVVIVVLTTLVGVAATVLLWQRPSSDYIDRRR